MAVSHPHPALPIPSISRCLPLGAVLGLLAAGCAPAAPPAQFPAERLAPAVEALDARGHYDAAYFAWDTGDYPNALEHAERALQAQGGDALLRQIALLTGEAYRVRELAPEGRAVRWSPDGSLALFESGEGPAVRTHVHRVEREALSEVAVIEGRGATASPDGARIAYLRVPETAELAAAREAAGRAQGAALRQARAEIARLEAAAAEVVVRQVATGTETVAATPGMERYSLLYAGDGSLIVVGRAAGEDDRTNLYRVGPDAAPEALTAGPGVRGATLLPVGQDRILYSVDGEGFVVRELATGRERAFAGTSPTVSADGSTVAYLTTREVPDEVRRGEGVVGADGRGRGHLTSLMVARLAGDAEPVEIRRTTLPLSDPAPLTLRPPGRLPGRAA
jgi:dipeptidyl aminopeptidase/acylaminoacyl peptidase